MLQQSKSGRWVTILKPSKSGRWKTIKNIDAFPRTDEHLLQKTSSGAAVSAAGLFIMAVLFVHELRFYLQTVTEHEMSVDTHRGEKLPIHLNMTFPGLPCEVLSVDAIDMSGQHEVDLHTSLWKLRVSRDGHVLGSEFVNDLVEGEHKRAKELKNSKNVTRSEHKNVTETVQGEPEADEKATDKEATDQEATDKEATDQEATDKEATDQEATDKEATDQEATDKEATDKEATDQEATDKEATDQEATDKEATDEKEVDEEAIAMPLTKNAMEYDPARVILDARKAIENGEGCRVFGVIDVERVAGNFHISMHGLSLFIASMIFEQGCEVNVSHIIHELSFGPRYPGVHNPLDGEERILHKNCGTFKYFMKIVPTEYHFLSGEIMPTNQFSVSEYYQEATPLDRAYPAVYFVYDLSPITVTITESRRNFGHFITRLCAVLGGTFAVTGMLDKWMFRIIEFMTSSK